MKAHLSPMNKKLLVIVISLIIVLTGGLGLYAFLNSFKEVSFDIINGINVTLTHSSKDSKTKIIDRFNSSKVLSLQAGKYCINPSGDNIDSSSICFEVKNKPMTIKVDPSYSEEYLSTILTNELPTLSSLINTTYAPIIGGYDIDSGKLYSKGEWYATTLTEKVAPSDRGDIYRLIAHKENGTWKITAFPQITISRLDYPGIPVNIIRDVNKIKATI